MKPLFENQHFLVIDKRAGYLSIPSRMGEADPRPCEITEWRDVVGNLMTVHRLDEEVSGLLMFAKTKESHRAASLWFENRQVKKTYEALTETVSGNFPDVSQKFIWESLLLRGKKRAYEKPFGKKSVTSAEFVSIHEVAIQKLGVWKLDPLTGRSHQLRYELAKHGYPIWGDALYGAKLKLPQTSAIALRAVCLDFSAASNVKEFEIPNKIITKNILEWTQALN